MLIFQGEIEDSSRGQKKKGGGSLNFVESNYPLQFAKNFAAKRIH